MHDQHKVLKHITFVKKPLHVYSIELEHVHTFRVGRHCIVTHNMALPCATLTISGTFEWLGLAKLATCFGPISVSVAIGGVVIGAATFYYFNRNKVVHYDLNFDIPHIEQRRWSERDIPTIGCCIYNDSAGILIPADDQSNTISIDRRNVGYDNSDRRVKTIPDILKDARHVRTTGSGTDLWEKYGGWKQALEDFESLELSNIRDISTGKVGTLPDGRSVNVRTKSSDTRVTLEIYDPVTEKSTKIRYENT